MLERARDGVRHKSYPRRRSPNRLGANAWGSSFIIVDGEAEVLREDGDEQTRIASLSAGQLFGEAAIMRDQPRSATVRAATDARLLALERDTFRDLIAQSMEIAPDFDQVIRARLDALGGD